MRDAAIAEGKQARLVINGDGAELDTTIVEHLRDPLSHLMRNAIAHGIESADERIRAGKSPEGQITLSAERKGASIFVDIRDDGRGLDANRIRSRAIQVGLLQKHEERSDHELFELIFEPGFSTLDEASRIAGRGVGMDVVRRNIEKVGGTVSIDSQTGIGTHIQIELPLTVAIVDTLGVGVGGEDYFIPLNTVVECLELPQALRNDSAGGVIELRGRPLPFIRLNRILNTRKTESSREHVVVIQHRGQRAGIAVDVLHGESQAVVKPLSALVPGTPGIAGTTIRSDGRVALLLDAPALLRKAVGWQTGGQHGGGTENRQSTTAGLTARAPLRS
ncbi:MAG: chemotaxis protein CheW [Myxococcales bacterium]|nr:chemotaxis protein CheW [Myxococcales bacterium]